MGSLRPPHTPHRNTHPLRAPSEPAGKENEAPSRPGRHFVRLPAFFFLRLCATAHARSAQRACAAPGGDWFPAAQCACTELRGIASRAWAEPGAGSAPSLGEVGVVLRGAPPPSSSSPAHAQKAETDFLKGPPFIDFIIIIAP